MQQVWEGCVHLHIRKEILFIYLGIPSLTLKNVVLYFLCGSE